MEVASWEEAQALWSQRSTELRSAAAEAVKSEGKRRQAVGLLLPQLSGTALASFSLLPAPPGDPGQAALFGAAPFQAATLVATLALIDARAWNQVAQAYDAQTAGQLSLAEARRLLLANLAQALLTVVAAERVAELNRLGLRDAFERLSLAEKSTRAGAATEIDLARTRQDTELARAQVLASAEGVRQAREALGLVLGQEVPVGVRPDFQLDALAARVPSPCRALAQLEERTDLGLARAREQLAHRGELDAKAQFLPTLGLRSTAQVFAIAGQAFPIWNLQAVLTVPLWDGGGRYGVLRETAAAKEQARAQREGAERVARTDLARAQRAIAVASQSQAVARQALEQAQRVDALTRRAFEAGLGTSLELVTAASSLRQQQLNLALRDYDVLRARVVALFALAECAE